MSRFASNYYSNNQNTSKPMERTKDLGIALQFRLLITLRTRIKRQHSYLQRKLNVSVDAHSTFCLCSCYKKICRVSESNQGHRDFQSLALPTELTRHILFNYHTQTLYPLAPSAQVLQINYIRSKIIIKH